VSEVQAGYEFPNTTDAQVKRVLERSAVRVFESENGGSQEGSGFVIDSENGLVVTAVHVVQGFGGHAWVAFPNSETRYRVSVLIHAPSPDFTVLQLDTPRPDTLALEVQFEGINDEESHRVTGFGRSNEDVVTANGQPSRHADCEYVVRVQTFHGDSGSAVLTPQGLVDGIAITGSESGGSGVMGETWILPLACVRDKILELVSDRDNTEILRALSAGNEQALRRVFQPLQPPPEPAGWISNLRLAKAVSQYIGPGQTTRRALTLSRDQAYMALPIIYDRRLGYRFAADFVIAGKGSSLEAGDVYQKFGDLQNSAGAKTAAKVAYKQATRLYSSYAAENLPPNWSPANDKTPNGYAIAKAYKSAADSETKMAKITGSVSDYQQAAQLAATAVYFAPNRALKSSSLAALGSAFDGAGDTPAAVSAFQKAQESGATAQWTKSSLSHLKTLLGERPPAPLADEYFANQAKMAVGSPLDDVLKHGVAF
jgi:tetratricopeptide (TPR) repeat protein